MPSVRTYQMNGGNRQEGRFIPWITATVTVPLEDLAESFRPQYLFS